MIIHRSASSPLLSRINEYWQTSGNRLQTLLEQRRIDDGEQAGGDGGSPLRRRAASKLRDSPNRSSATSQASQVSSPPGELDRFLLVNGTLKDTSCIGDMVLSIPNKRCPNNHLDFGESMADINDDDDTAISEVTFMTFRAELMKKALLMEYKMRKEAEWKEEQEKLERAIHRAYPDGTDETSGKGDEARNNCNTTELVEMAMKIALAKMNNEGGSGTGNNCKKTIARSADTRRMHRTMSTPDFHQQLQLQASFTSLNKAKSNKMDTLTERDEGDEEEMVQKRGELAVEFGLRPLHKMQGNDSQETSEDDDQVVGRPAVNPQVDTDQRAVPQCKLGGGDDHEGNNNNNINREWYLDSIIELKLQLAQKQSDMDELTSKYNQLLRESSRKARKEKKENMDNFRLVQENAKLKLQASKLQNLLNDCALKPTKMGRNHSGTTATTATFSVLSA